MPIVDAHPHIYSPDRNAYPTIAEPWEPGEPASAQDLKKRMDAVGVDRAVFIQTSTFYGHDNRYVMDSARDNADWACGVVTLDPDDASHLDVLEDAVKNSNIRGMRGTTDAIGRISSMGVYRLWTKAMDLGIPVNCMVMDDLERVPEIERIAGDLGDLKIVIDHCFMLNTRHRTEETLFALERLARLPNVYAKLTCGTHGSYRVYPFVDMHDPLKRVIGAFGPDRCVWGSNFPNTLWSKGASYAQNLHLFVKELGLSLPDKAHILGVTAMSLWFPNEQGQMERAAREQQERTEREAIKAQEAADSADQDDVTEPGEPDARAAEVTNIADIISSEKGIDARPNGPGANDEREMELHALLDVTNQLSAVLGPMSGQPAEVEFEREQDPAEVSDSESEPEPEPEIDIESAKPGEDHVKGAKPALTIEDLLGEVVATPNKTDKIGESGDAGEHDDEMDMDAANQLTEAHESVNDRAAVSIEDQSADREPDAAPVNLEELMASQNYTPIKTDEIGKSDGIAEGEVDLNALSDIANQLNSALESSDEPAADTAPEVDVEALLAAQDDADIEADTSAEPAGSAKDDDEFDVSALMDVANQLNSMLESVDDLASDIADAASIAEDQPDTDARSSA